MCWKKLSLVMSLFVVLSSPVTISATRSHAVKPDCEVPKNAITIDMMKLVGVWYIHGILNYGASVNAMACARVEYVAGSDDRSVIEALNYFSNATGAFTPDIYELVQFRSGLIELKNLRDRSMKVYYYPLKFDSASSFVVSVCFVKNGKRLAQPISIFSKNQEETQTFLESEAKSAGVEIQQSYLVPNKNCYKLY